VGLYVDLAGLGGVAQEKVGVSGFICNFGELGRESGEKVGGSGVGCDF